MENFKKTTVTFFPQQLRFDNINHWKADKISYKMVYFVNLYNFVQWVEPIYTGLLPGLLNIFIHFRFRI